MELPCVYFSPHYKWFTRCKCILVSTAGRILVLETMLEAGMKCYSCEIVNHDIHLMGLPVCVLCWGITWLKFIEPCTSEERHAKILRRGNREILIFSLFLLHFPNHFFKIWFFKGNSIFGLLLHESISYLLIHAGNGTMILQPSSSFLLWKLP